MYYHPAPTKTQTPNKDEVFLFLLSLQYLTKTTLENFINPLGWADIQILQEGIHLIFIILRDNCISISGLLYLVPGFSGLPWLGTKLNSNWRFYFFSRIIFLFQSRATTMLFDRKPPRPCNESNSVKYFPKPLFFRALAGTDILILILTGTGKNTNYTNYCHTVTE